MSDNTYIIELSGDRYKVRKHGEERQILVMHTWMDSDDFVDYLISAGKVNAVCELALLGNRVVREEVYE